jgi:hypothetical protein
MEIINALKDVGVVGMWRSLPAFAAAPAAHPAAFAHADAGAAAAINPQRKRRTATATRPSVDRGTT